MPYAVDLLPGHAVIRVVFSGTAGLQDRADALDTLIARQAESAYRKVLIDLSQATLADAANAETFAYAARLARDPVMRGMRIAYVGDASPSVSIESLAALRGYFYQRFRSQAAALRWLCGEETLPRVA